MERITVRRAFAVAIATMVGAATVLVGAGPAAAAKRQAAGTYTATFPTTATTSKLVITNAAGSTSSGSFAFTDIGDYGTWVAQGTTVAFDVSVSNSGHQDAVMIGTLTATGIGPAVLGQPGVGTQSWSATRVSGASGAAATTTAFAAPPRVRRAAAKGTVYHAVFNGTLSDTLTVNKDSASKTEGTFTLTTLGDAGTWVKLGKKMALGLTSGDAAGIVMTGTQTASGISDTGAAGVYYQAGSGVHSWYATKG